MVVRDCQLKLKLNKFVKANKPAFCSKIYFLIRSTPSPSPMHEQIERSCWEEIWKECISNGLFVCLSGLIQTCQISHSPSSWFFPPSQLSPIRSETKIVKLGQVKLTQTCRFHMAPILIPPDFFCPSQLSPNRSETKNCQTRSSQFNSNLRFSHDLLPPDFFCPSQLFS